MHDDVDILNHHRITDIMCLIGVRYMQDLRSVMGPTAVRRQPASMPHEATCRPRGI